MPKPDYITSDVHLGAIPEARERSFVRFLGHAGESAGRLLIPGDLFDFWFEYGEVIPGRHFRVLAALRDLVDAGVPVTLLGGNHDAWGGRFLEEHVGVSFHPGQVRMEIAGRPALLAHGDGLGQGDIRYRILKTVLRSRAAVWAFRALHPELGLKLARRVSSTEAKSDEDPGKQGRAAFIEEWAREMLARDPSLGWVVCGHAHLPAVVQVEPGRHYLNAGDWLTHRTYIVIGDDGRPELCEWEGV
ncbi:MAG TPA: UDP-2,3-diacylglucosamine diphosphatase [Longimicrobiales bacterium]|nr:UDP-2,3-diacylglucosamine diphosphatase [Longimicrobiales bacterium]